MISDRADCRHNYLCDINAYVFIIFLNEDWLSIGGIGLHSFLGVLVWHSLRKHQWGLRCIG